MVGLFKIIYNISFTRLLLLFSLLFFTNFCISENIECRCMVIDIDRVIVQSESYKNFKSLWDNENAKLQKDIEFYESQNVVLDKQIVSNQYVLKVDELSKLKKQLADNEIKIQKLIQTRKIYLEETFAEAIDQLRNTISKIVAKYATKNSLKLVIPKSQTIYIDKKVDITDKILLILNQELKQLKTKLE